MRLLRLFHVGGKRQVEINTRSLISQLYSSPFSSTPLQILSANVPLSSSRASHPIAFTWPRQNNLIQNGALNPTPSSIDDNFRLSIENMIIIRIILVITVIIAVGSLLVCCIDAITAKLTIPLLTAKIQGLKSYEPNLFFEISVNDQTLEFFEFHF